MSVIVAPVEYVDLSVALVRTSWLSLQAGGPQGRSDDDGPLLPEHATSGPTVDAVVGAGGCDVAVAAGTVLGGAEEMVAVEDVVGTEAVGWPGLARWRGEFC